MPANLRSSVSKPSLPPIPEYTRNSSQGKIKTGAYDIISKTEAKNTVDRDPYGLAEKNEEIRSRRMLREPEKPIYGENSSMMLKSPESKNQVVGSRRILGSRRLTSEAKQISPSRQFMTGPGHSIERRDDLIALHDQKAHLAEIISPSGRRMMPTTKEIREMTESRRVALGLQSRAYNSVANLSKDGGKRWEQAPARNDYVDNFKPLKPITEVLPARERSSRVNFATHDGRGGFDGHRDQQIGYTSKMPTVSNP